MAQLARSLLLLLLAATLSPLSAERPQRTVTFAGFTWLVREALAPEAPGPNRFSASRRNIFIDESGALHLKMLNNRGRWYAAEVRYKGAVGYGTYRFEVERRGFWPPGAVGGFFLWDNNAPPLYREIDVEYSHWGGEVPWTDWQYAVQPHTEPGNLYRFDGGQEAQSGARRSQHEIVWQPDQLIIRTFIGGKMIAEWRHDNPPEAPEPGSTMEFRINLYLYKGNPAGEIREDDPPELVLSSFTEEPHGKP